VGSGYEFEGSEAYCSEGVPVSKGEVEEGFSVTISNGCGCMGDGIMIQLKITATNILNTLLLRQVDTVWACWPGLAQPKDRFVYLIQTKSVMRKDDDSSAPFLAGYGEEAATFSMFVIACTTTL
jgi:hypothetical protein